MAPIPFNTLLNQKALVVAATLRSWLFNALEWAENGGKGKQKYGGIIMPRGSQIAIAIIFLIFQKIKKKKKNPENIITITSII